MLHQKGHDGEPGAWKDAGDTRPLPSFTPTDGQSVCLYCWARACFTLFGQNDRGSSDTTECPDHVVASLEVFLVMRLHPRSVGTGL